MPASPMAANRASLMKWTWAFTAAPITSTKNPIIVILMAAVVSADKIKIKTLRTCIWNNFLIETRVFGRNGLMQM